MATDFNKPVVTDAYAVMLPAIAQAHKDLARMLEPTLTGTHTNVPVGTVQWNATTVRWERYNGTSWVTLPAAGDNVYGISISGNAAGLTSTRSNWPDTPAKDNVVGLLSWRRFGNGHVIFDASTGLSPEGGVVNPTNPTYPWSVDYPTLMGWNGAATYGVRVDSARVSDMATKLATARTIGGVSFDGTADINLPGVNTTGNQNTTGNAATATSATSATTAASCSGNAATATAANAGYFTVSASYPKIELHKPGFAAGQWAIDAANNFIFETTNGTGTPGSDLLTLTYPSGVLTSLGGFGGNAATATKLVNDVGSGPGFSCRAWVNFNGTGTVLIRASGNVSSITDNGVGDYTVNFTTAMSDANFSTVTTTSNSAASGPLAFREWTSRSATSVRIKTASTSPTLVDNDEVCVAVFR